MPENSHAWQVSTENSRRIEELQKEVHAIAIKLQALVDAVDEMRAQIDETESHRAKREAQALEDMKNIKVQMQQVSRAIWIGKGAIGVLSVIGGFAWALRDRIIATFGR